MAELDDLMSSFPFRCQKCDAELTSDLLLKAVVTYGVVLLVGEKDGFIGWSCPGCQGLKTNFTKLEREPFNQVVYAFRSILENGQIGKLCYHSFPYRFDLKDTDFSGRASRERHADFEAVHETDFSGLADIEVDDDFEAVHVGSFILDEPNLKPPATYCSYEFGSDALGPAISVWWYDDYQVKKLTEQENKTGLRLFPRYIVHNQLYSMIDDFCWHNRVHFEYLKASNLPFDIKEIFLSSEKKRITKAFDFLMLLDTVNLAELSSLSSTGSQVFISAPTISSDMIAPVESSPKKISTIQHENLSNQVWSAFHAEWMQQLLENIAEDFISDYLSQIGKVDCSFSSLCALKETYIETLFDAVSSRYKRDKIIEDTNANMRKRVAEYEKSFPNSKIVSENIAINGIKEQISKTAHSNLAYSFLILGERGTGKEIFAKAIHEASKQKGRLIKVDCGSITETLFESEIFGHMKGSFTGADKDRLGAFEEANGGSIFFDEIGNLPLNLQPKLLRALQDQKYVPVGTSTERSINAKFIFATNKNIDDMVRKDLFMPDLYDRFNSFPIIIPPLRERKEDIEILVKHFINLFGTQDNNDYGDLPVSKDCLKFLKSRDWPGNIRDLEKAIRFVMINRIAYQDKSEITELDLPAEIGVKEKRVNPTVVRKNKLPGNKKIEDDEIIHWMKEFGNNKTRVAKQLGVTPKTIWLRCKKLGL